jgi:MFS family permease
VNTDAVLYPARGLAWRSAIIIFLLTAIATADRMGIAMLIGPIKKDFAIGDFQASLLVGAAFTSFYMLFLLPIGWAADRLSRRKVLAVCLLIWSVATMACGWATGFVMLFITRMLVGAGEAALAPCCHGIVGDSFAREALAKPLALQGIGFQVGSAAGVAAAGAILAASTSGALEGLPIVGEMTGWRAAFVLIGLPGIAALLLIPLLHDPRDHRTTEQRAKPATPFMPFLRQHPALVTFTLLAGGLSGAGLGCVAAWMPEYLQRAYAVPPMQAGATLGSVMLLAAFAGQGVFAIITDWCAARGMRDAPLRIGLIPVALSIPLAWMAFNAPDQASFMPWFILMMLCIAPCNAMSNTLVQIIAPAPLRSRMAAISILTISLLGFTAGPALVGWLSEYVFGEANLGTALKLVISGAMAGTLLFLLLLRPRLLAYLGDS